MVLHFEGYDCLLFNSLLDLGSDGLTVLFSLFFCSIVGLKQL